MINTEVPTHQVINKLSDAWLRRDEVNADMAHIYPDRQPL